MVKVMPDGSIEEKTRKINPTIPIPTETSMIHGIYDEDVKDEPTFNQIAKSLNQNENISILQKLVDIEKAINKL